MNRNKNIVLGSALLLVLICLLPVGAQAVTSSETIPTSQYRYLILNTGQAIGSFTATGPIDAYISDNRNSGTPPGGELWVVTNAYSGNWDVSIPDDANTYYLVFSNVGGSSSSTVSYTIGGGIPGFELVYAVFALMALLGIFLLRKKSIL